MKKIILTGGGTAGHVTPNLALIPSLKEHGYEIHYIGSYQGIERKLIEGAGIPYDGISSGKLRRYFDIKNFSDPFRVVKGYGEARKLIKLHRPDVVFSKGGFVAAIHKPAPEPMGGPLYSSNSHLDHQMPVPPWLFLNVLPACANYAY